MGGAAIDQTKQTVIEVREVRLEILGRSLKFAGGEETEILE